MLLELLASLQHGLTGFPVQVVESWWLDEKRVEREEVNWISRVVGLTGTPVQVVESWCLDVKWVEREEMNYVSLLVALDFAAEGS